MEKNFGLSCCWNRISLPIYLILNIRLKPFVIFILTACCVNASARTLVPVSESKATFQQDESNNTDSVQTSEWLSVSVVACQNSNPTKKYPTPLIQLLALFDSNTIIFSGNSVMGFADKKMTCCDYYNNVLMKQQCLKTKTLKEEY